MNIVKKKNFIIKTSAIFLILLSAFSFSKPAFSQKKDEEKEGAVKPKEEKKELEITKKNSFRPDFRDTEITDFIKAMSKLIDKNIIADEKLKGKITVISPKRIHKSMAYNYFTTVLTVKGFSVVEEGDILKISPLKDALAIEQDVHFGREPLLPGWVKENKAITAIFSVLSGKPSRLAGILKRLTSANTNLVDYDELNMLVIMGDAVEVNRLLTLIPTLDPKDKVIEEDLGEDFDFVHLYTVQNMEADKIEATLRKMRIPEMKQQTPAAQPQQQNNDPRRQGQPQRRPAPPAPVHKPGQSNTSKQIDIVSHKESNNLIYIGSREEFKEIKRLIKKLDIKRDQVLLEVLIVEVSEDDANSFGIDWSFGSGQFNSGLTAESGILNIDSESGAISKNPINTLLGFSLGYLSDNGGGPNLMSLLNANINKENFAILSAPQILTLSNQEAEINVGEDVPVATGMRLSDASGDSNFSYEYKSVGVRLKFTPQVNSNKEITIDLYQEVKAKTGSDDFTKNPTFKKRDIKTVVRVKDNQTIVIGGLISTDKTRTERKVPLLGDIPVLGYLFKRTSMQVKKTNLLVFITPHILSSRKIADSITNQAIEMQKSTN